MNYFAVISKESLLPLTELARVRYTIICHRDSHVPKQIVANSPIHGIHIFHLYILHYHTFFMSCLAAGTSQGYAQIEGMLYYIGMQ